LNELLSVQAELSRHFSNELVTDVATRRVMAEHGPRRCQATGKVLIQEMDMLSVVFNQKALSLKSLSNFAVLEGHQHSY
jgi:hypothetical protein